MNSQTDQPRSLSVKASWASLGLALGCACIFVVFRAVDQVLPFDQTKDGLLTGFLPRTILYVLWVGEALAVVVGIVCFLLIRRKDTASKAIVGIVVRSFVGLVLGVFGVLFLWLYIGHVVIGF